MQLLLAVLQPAPICRVDDPNEAVGRLEVVPPIRSKRLLATDVPDVQVVPRHEERPFKRILVPRNGPIHKKAEGAAGVGFH